MSLVITPVSGDPVHLDCTGVQTPAGRQGPSRFTGLQGADQIIFSFDAYVRARLFELMPLAGLNVRQTPNRKRVQLTSDKVCAYCKFRWNAPRYQIDTFGWNELYTYAEAQGVFAITSATVQGFHESLSLTLFAGDWLWDGEKAINFEMEGA